MFKTSLLLLLLSVLVITGCSGGKEKTEIKVQFSEAEYLFNLAANGKDSTYLAAYNFAMANSGTGSEDFLSVFSKKISEIDPEYRLASLYNLVEFRDKINFESSNQDVVKVLNEDIKLASEMIIQVMKRRIEYACESASYASDVSGKVEVSIKEQPEKNTFLITANRKLDKTRIKNLLQVKADFGFWETYNLPEIWEYLVNANNALKETLNGGDSETTVAAQKDTAKAVIDNPLFNILIPPVSQDGNLKEGNIIGVSKIGDTSQVIKYLITPFVKSLFPRNLIFMWEKKPSAFDSNLVNLIAVKATTRDGRAPLSGSYIVEAKSKESKGHSIVRIKMNSEGAKILSRFTRDNVIRFIVLVNNKTVYSNIYISSEIETGDFEISGSFTPGDADEIAALLNAGPMPEFGIEVISVN